MSTTNRLNYQWWDVEEMRKGCEEAVSVSNFKENKYDILWIKTGKHVNSMKLPLGLWWNVVGLITKNKPVCLLCWEDRETEVRMAAQKHKTHGSGGGEEKVTLQCFYAFSHFCKLTTSLLTLSLCLLALEQRFPSVGVSIIYETDQGVTMSLHEA